MNGARDIAIVGVHATRQQKKSGRTVVSMMMESIRGALDDAGIPLSEVDGYISYIFPAGNGRGFDDGAHGWQPIDTPPMITLAWPAGNRRRPATKEA